MPNRASPGLLIERHCAISAAALASVACFYTWGCIPLPGSWKELLGAIFTAAATGAGFLFTAASIVISMDGKPVIKWGRETGAYGMFAGYMMRGVAWCLFASLVTLVMFVPDFARPAGWHKPAFSIWWGSIAGTAVAVVRVLLILSAILRESSKDASNAGA